jgi:hypothetical protein
MLHNPNGGAMVSEALFIRVVEVVVTVVQTTG